MQTLAKKFFAVGSAVAMTLALVTPFVGQAAAHGAGTNVKSSDGTIWMITASGTRRAYTSLGAFQSYGFNSLATVVAANSDDLALPVDSAGFIPPQDGKIFCATATKGSDVKGECSLISGGMKSAFTSASVFTGLGFSFSRAQYGDSSFLTKAANISNSTSAHLPGVLVNNNGTVQLVGANGLMGIPDLTTFNSWGYSFADVVPANAADKAMSQTGVMAARTAGQLSPSTVATTGNTGNTGNTPVVNGSVSAMLGSDTPAASTLVSNSTSCSTNPTVYCGSQVGADVAHFTFTGSGTVTQVVIHRIGVSSDTSLANVYLYMGNNRITDAGTFSNGNVTFSNSNGLFTVSGSTTISVRADVAGNISGQTFGAQLASFTVANGSPMSTSISGNLFNIASVSDAATVKLTVSSGNTTILGAGASGGTAGTINAGTMNASLWNTTVTVGQRAVKMSYIQFRQIGSVSANAIQNLNLFIDGNKVGSPASITNNGSLTNVVVFDLSGSPVTLTTGSHTLDLHGDIIGGTSYNYEFTLQTQSDALFWDTSYNVAVPLTYSGGSTILQLNPGVTTVNSGTVSVQLDPNFTQTQFVKNGSQVVLGSWTMKAYGENVKVQTLQVILNYTGQPTTAEGFNNLGLFVNGGQVGSSQSALSNGSQLTTTLTFGTTNLFTIPAGQTVTIQVKGDNTLLANGSLVTAVRADLVATASAFQGVTSFALSPASNTTYTGTSLSIGTSNATLSANAGYTNQSIGPNVTKQKIGSFVIQASQADGVRVNQLTVTFAAGANNTIPPSTGLANLYLVTPDFPNGTTPQAPASSTPSFSTNFTINANQTANVDVYADVTNTSGKVQVTLAGTGVGTTSGQSVTLSGQVGQVITVATGTLGTPTLAASSPVDSFVIAGGQNIPVATFNATSTSGNVTITQIDFMASTTTASIPVTAITLGGVTVPMVGNSTPRATSTVTGLNIVVPTTYSGVNIPVTMNLAQVGNNGIAGNLPFTLNLTHVKYTSGGTTTDAYFNVASNSFILVGSAPTITLASVPAGTLLTTGNQTVAKVTVTANSGGDITLEGLPLTISAAGGATASTTVSATTVTVVDDVTGQTVSQTHSPEFTVPSGSSSSTTLTLSSDNRIAAGTSKTYDIQLPITGSFGTSPSASISVVLGAATSFTFKDINSNADAVAVKQTNTLNGASLTATYVPNYPTNSVSLHN